MIEPSSSDPAINVQMNSLEVRYPVRKRRYHTSRHYSSPLVPENTDAEGPGDGVLFQAYNGLQDRERWSTDRLRQCDRALLHSFNSFIVSSPSLLRGVQWKALGGQRCVIWSGPASTHTHVQKKWLKAHLSQEKGCCVSGCGAVGSCKVIVIKKDLPLRLGYLWPPLKVLSNCIFSAFCA